MEKDSENVIEKSKDDKKGNEEPININGKENNLKDKKGGDHEGDKTNLNNKNKEKEMEKLLELLEEMESIKDQLKALGVDSILSNSAAFKFDAPPVIKNGRTLIPVRAITEEEVVTPVDETVTE